MPAAERKKTGLNRSDREEVRGLGPVSLRNSDEARGYRWG